MNTSEQDKFPAHISAVRDTQPLPQILQVSWYDPAEIDRRQTAFLARHFGLHEHRARLVAGLAFSGGAP